MAGCGLGTKAGSWFVQGHSEQECESCVKLGYFDGHDYLCLSGRYKEIINRGGEKISPFEVSRLMNQAVTCLKVPSH